MLKLFSAPGTCALASQIEQEMFQGPWVMGGTYTVCAPYLFTISQWIEADGVDIARFPRIRTHVQDMLARPAVARALASTKTS